MAKKEWSPRKVAGAPLVPLLTNLLEEGIEGQRMLTEYDGPDDEWVSFVANRVWPSEDYQRIGIGDGFLKALLAVVHDAKVPVPKALVERAIKYIYTD